MFGFGKNKFHQQVIDMIEDMAKTLIVTPNTSEEFKTIEKEVKASGGTAEDLKDLWPLMVANCFCLPLEHKEHIDYAFKNFNVRQAAFYSISTYITQIALNGTLADYKKTQPEMYDAFKTFWGMCGEAVWQNEEEFGHCVISPGENPFD